VTVHESLPAISIRQPWAELILCEKKKIEVRSWDSTYRGQLYLHTGKVPDGYRILDYDMKDVFRGGYIGIIEIAAIVPFTEERWNQWKDQHLSEGTFKSGLYAWIIRNPKRFKIPISAPGELGLYQPALDILKLLEEMPVIENS
jgi:hypothetical protein